MNFFLSFLTNTFKEYAKRNVLRWRKDVKSSRGRSVHTKDGRVESLLRKDEPRNKNRGGLL